MAETITKNVSPIFVPTKQQSLDRTRVYNHLTEMREKKERAMPHFQTGPDGARSFNTYIDDSERILNGYTISREGQGKEEWQSNLLDNITRSKLRAVAAGVGLKVPEMVFEASNKEGIRSRVRADIFKNIIKQTYNDGNPTLNTFLEVWHMMSHGVVFEYEGYKTGGAMQEVVESFNSLTGKIKTKKEYRKMDGKPFSVIINPQEFYWHTFFVRDIQDQPRVAWVQHYTKAELELEFSKYPNYKFIKDKAGVSEFAPMQSQLYFQEWSERVDDKDDYEVLRYYSKADEAIEDANGYEVWINGVPMIQSPLLWGDKEKVYPFAKQISETFANTNFFVGMSFPALLEAYQDGKNTILNTLVDKLYRAVDPLKLVGLQNRDLLDVEAEIVSQDNTIYVPDINAVKFMEHPGINNGELAMLGILDRGIETSSISNEQQGSGGGKKTATQVKVETQQAAEIKSILFIFLEDLWLQKTKLRNEIILTHYIKDKAAQDTKKGNIITIKDYTFGDGERGILDIHVAKNKNSRMSKQEIESREQAMDEQGEAYKLISIDVNYLNDWEYDYKILPGSFSQREKADEEESLMSEINQVTTLFPEFFVANKDAYLKEVLELHDKNVEDFNPPVEQQPVEGEGAPTEAQPEQGLPAPQEEGSVLGL